MQGMKAKGLQWEDRNIKHIPPGQAGWPVSPKIDCVCVLSAWITTSATAPCFLLNARDLTQPFKLGGGGASTVPMEISIALNIKDY